MSKKKFTYASAFAGIGGMTMGLESLGGECVIAWEFDPESKRQYAQEAHKLLHPHIPIEGDIRETSLDDIPYFDILCFTPPCQSFSVAGNRGGFEDTRGTLIFDVLRIAKHIKPKVLFMENVKGLLSHDNYRTKSIIVKSINDIGYRVDFNIINSKDFIPQKRERDYLIAIRDDLVDKEEWSTKGISTLNKSKKKISSLGVNSFNFDWDLELNNNIKLKDILECDVDEKYYISKVNTDKIMNKIRDEDLSDVIAIKGDLIDRANPRGQYGFSKDYMFTLRVAQVHGVALKVENEYRIRKLTPRECLRLQSVDEKYIELLMDNFSASRIYKFAGNGLTINVVRAIGEKILKYI